MLGSGPGYAVYYWGAMVRGEEIQSSDIVSAA